ncbi:MAG TPA: class I SAM-dependent methyltransferase [Spirochaetia bacterium]|nr:class I SAM-dependent methyltransferase [Spirochaetia bacterium]
MEGGDPASLKLYSNLASWFHLVSSPADYGEEAEFYTRTLRGAVSPAPRTVLELGSGGGNNALHMKAHFQMTLSDLSAEMLDLSRTINPECEHIVGDMRTLRLGKRFDAVFIHDAICYMTDEASLKSAIETAVIHCREGGAVLLAPDEVKETFRSTTYQGGHDEGDHGLRFLEWTWDPDPADTTYVADWAYLLRDPSGSVHVEHERHTLGLFDRASWLRVMRELGLKASSLRFDRTGSAPGPTEAFLGLR